jgi:hypothetical protein
MDGGLVIATPSEVRPCLKCSNGKRQYPSQTGQQLDGICYSRYWFGRFRVLGYNVYQSVENLTYVSEEHAALVFRING